MSHPVPPAQKSFRPHRAHPRRVPAGWLPGVMLIGAVASCGNPPDRSARDGPVAAPGGKDSATTETGPTGPRDAGARDPADSLVLRTSGGYEVWLTDARVGRDSATGETCTERSVEIVTDTSRRKVPLLYTRVAPTELDRRNLRALLFLGCRPVAVYRVELATARPTRIGNP